MTPTDFARRINAITEPAARLDALLPLLARFTFGAVPALYFWASALTKLGDRFFRVFVSISWDLCANFPTCHGKYRI